ncbi:MAG: heavy metal translocating P-type ATPase [Simkaniaceae bacterium]|nr:heavy metal translocating P-type ATPase [Candidatus Sacchlamyda saccharinae]
MSQPYIFDEFFASGRAETISPFLTPHSRSWGRNLPLKGAILAAILLALTFGFTFVNQDVSHICLASVYFLVGTPALLNALEDLKSLEINIDVLMTLAALLSIVIGSGIEGALLLVLFEFSGAMENAVTQKTKNALISLRRLSPNTALVLQEDGSYLERSVREIPLGSLILIKAGEVVPLDGEVTAGSSYVNLVHLTGESQPLAKREKDQVPAGAHNLDGTLTLKVNRTSTDSTLSRVITLITKAQEAKPKLERLFDRLSKTYSITIILLSLFFALSFPFIFSMPFLGDEGSIYRALTFLIAASPCALIIAVPTAYLSAISSCARKGIILKGGTILDALASCSIIAFDKTGTLTTGNLTCSGIDPLTNSTLSTDTALAVAAGLEKGAVHPISEAIIKLASEKQITAHNITDFKSVPGFGLEGNISIDGQTYHACIGHPDFIEQKLPGALKIEKWETQNTFLTIGDHLFVFHFTDELRPKVHETLPALKEQNLKSILVTGDHTENAHVVAKKLQIEDVFANLRPEDKLEKVAELSQEQGLIMVGDGVNDAPALARSTVGISMGKIGSATAVDASDVVFLQDDLSLLDWLIGKSHKTMRIVKQNLILALAVICLATTPALLGYIPLWLAVILHEGGTVLVGFNSLRLLK